MKRSRLATSVRKFTPGRRSGTILTTRSQQAGDAGGNLTRSMASNPPTVVVAAKTPVSRANCFDVLRLIAAAAVVVEHGTFYLHANFLWHSHSDSWWLNDGVAMFFVMSGLLVYKSGERSVALTGRWIEYFRNRFLRIAPAIYAYALVITIVLVSIGALSLADLASVQYAKFVLCHLLLAPFYDMPALDHFGVGVINGSLWTIPAECSFYVAVPVLYLIARRFGFNRMILLLVPVALVAPVVASHGGLPGKLAHITFVQYAACFGVGVWWSKRWDRTPQHWLLPVLALAAYGALPRLLPGVDSELHPALVAIPLGYVAVWVGYHGPAWLAGIPRQIGDWSFGTYIWHMPLANLFVWGGITGAAYSVPLLLACSLAAGAASWWIVERRALARKRISGWAPVERPALRTALLHGPRSSASPEPEVAHAAGSSAAV